VTEERETVELDMAKVAVAMSLLGVSTISEVVDIAFDELIRYERSSRDEALDH
jgi:Arc/MetJ family transcription regulator